MEKYLADNIPMSKSTNEVQSSQSHHQPITHIQMQQDDNSIYYDLK